MSRRAPRRLVECSIGGQNSVADYWPVTSRLSYVNDLGQASAATPAQILAVTPAPDDAGAETYDRFDWQCAMATADLLAFYFGQLSAGGSPPDGVVFELICEHHEDWALSNGVKAEIISAKHHERGFGTYSTLKQLLDEGGVLHLLDRWLALQKTPECRVMTTSGLSGDAQLLERACAHFSEQDEGALEVGEHEELLSRFAKEITNRRVTKLRSADPKATEASVEVESPETLAAFLRILRVTHGLPFRDDLQYSASSRYAMPVAKALGRDDAADAIWHALLNVVRERMRAAGPHPRASLPLVLGAKDEPGFEKRMLTLSDVDTIIGVALANPSGYRPLPKQIKTTRVAVKMSVGGCSDNAIARAENLRLQFRKHWRTVTSGPGRVSSRQKIENVLQRIVEEETELVSGDAGPWGTALWSSVRLRLDALENSPKAQGLDADLLLGGVAELSNNCLVWFSEGFDADTFARDLAEEATQ